MQTPKTKVRVLETKHADVRNGDVYEAGWRPDLNGWELTVPNVTNATTRIVETRIAFCAAHEGEEVYD